MPALTKLWRTDGTSAGTTLLAAIDAHTTEELEMVARNGVVFFTAPGATSGVELWISDGTPGGTAPFDLNPGPASSSPRRLTVDLHTTATSVYFSAVDAIAGREPWVSDGTAAGTRRIGNIAAGTARVPARVVDRLLRCHEWHDRSRTVALRPRGAPVFHAASCRAPAAPARTVSSRRCPT